MSHEKRALQPFLHELEHRALLKACLSEGTTLNTSIQTEENLTVVIIVIYCSIKSKMVSC